MLEIKTIQKNDLAKFQDVLLEFYANKYKFPVTPITLSNSAIICFAVIDKQVVGAIRTISDLSRHALIVDLFVAEEFRKKKIGGKLLNSLLTELKHYQVKNITISTEPTLFWLTNFYKKNGFVPASDSVYMEFEK